MDLLIFSCYIFFGGVTTFAKWLSTPGCEKVKIKLNGVVERPMSSSGRGQTDDNDDDDEDTLFIIILLYV